MSWNGLVLGHYVWCIAWHLTQHNGQGLDHSIVHVHLLRAFPVVVLRMWPFMVKTEPREIKIRLFGSAK
jgi:hypothetical protein